MLLQVLQLHCLKGGQQSCYRHTPTQLYNSQGLQLSLPKSTNRILSHQESNTRRPNNALALSWPGLHEPSSTVY